MNLFIDWDVSPEIIKGYKTPNLYGLLFVSGLIIGFFVIKKMFKKENVEEAVLDKLVMYVVLATIVGARLGHVLFYGPYYDTKDHCNQLQHGYFEHPMDIFKVWEGGLASHGGAIAVLLALMYFSKKVSKRPLMWILDRIAIPIAIAATFIRLGNLVNHEIVGDRTNVPWAFSFHNYYDEALCGIDASPRHPTQLYEAICYLFIFVLLYFLYWKKEAWKKQGYVFGLFLTLLFTARFLIEFVKVGQTDRDSYMILNTGQMLSIPFMIAGAIIFWKAIKRKTDSLI